MDSVLLELGGGGGGGVFDCMFTILAGGGVSHTIILPLGLPAQKCCVVWKPLELIFNYSSGCKVQMNTFRHKSLS